MTLSRLVVLLTAPIDAATLKKRLGPDRFDTAEMDGPADPFARWTAWIEINGMAVRFTAEEPPALHGWHFEQPKWAPGERARAEDAKAALGIEAELEEPPLGAYKDELAIARAASGPELAAIYDENAERLLPPSQLPERLLEPRDLFSIHSVGPAATGPFWIHTHGLGRARVPDLDALSVPSTGREAAGELLDATASLFLSYGVPPRAKPFPVGEGIDLVLLPLDEALARLPKDEPGSLASRGEEHREEERVVLAPADSRHGGSPSLARILPRVSRAVLFRSPEETEAMRRTAKKTWGEFARLFAAHRSDAGWRFLVKLGYEPDRSRDTREAVAREHLWFRVQSVDEGRVEAVLESSPRDLAALKPGEARWHELSRLTAWLVLSPSGEIGPGKVLVPGHVDP